MYFDRNAFHQARIARKAAEEAARVKAQLEALKEQERLLSEADSLLHKYRKLAQVVRAFIQAW